MSKNKNLTDKIIDGSVLSESESNLFAENVINRKINDYEIVSLLSFLFQNGEKYEEIFAFVKLLRKKMKKISLSGSIMDTCGTGGDYKNSFNFSTATSIVLSACDVKIAKHGNRSVTSKSGSFDLLESLGIKLDLNKNDTVKYFKKNNICFLFAPHYHSVLKNFSEIRRSLPFRTIFNLLGPLLNPVKLDYQLLGVSDEKNLETHAKCISKLNLKKAWVVYNLNGYDELTTTSKNLFIEVKNGKVSKKRVLDPGEIGFKIRKDQELRGGSAQENSFLMKRVFEGETGAIRDNIVLNAAAGLLISGKVKTIKQGISVVENKINNGLILNKLKSLTQK